jgi:hypothetical protein
MFKQGMTKTSLHFEQSGYWRGGMVSSLNLSTTVCGVMEGEAWFEDLGEETAWVVFFAVKTAWTWAVVDTAWR